MFVLKTVSAQDSYPVFSTVIQLDKPFALY